MQLDDYANPTCAAMHKVGERIALYAIIIGVACILFAIIAAGFSIHAMLQMRAMFAGFPAGAIQNANLSAFGSNANFLASPGTMIFLALLQGGYMVVVGLAIIAFGQWLKWLQIGQAEALDAQVRIMDVMARRLQQQ